jgi:hypothetical protein
METMLNGLHNNQSGEIVFSAVWPTLVALIIGSVGLALGMDSLPADLADPLKNVFYALVVAILPTMFLLTMKSRLRGEREHD